MTNIVYLNDYRRSKENIERVAARENIKALTSQLPVGMLDKELRKLVKIMEKKNVNI